MPVFFQCVYVGPKQRHNIQIWAGQLHNRSGDESGLGTGGVSGESVQDVVSLFGILDGTTSDPTPVTLGVPQGSESILGL